MTGRWAKMTLVIIGLVSFAAIFGGALIGLFVRSHLPEQQLSRETQSAVTVAVAVIGTLSALVLGLMISAANSSFSKRSDDVRELSILAIRIDRSLRRYGPEANDARAKLHAWVTIKVQQYFPEKGKSLPSSETAIKTLESVLSAVLDLTPQNQRQKYLYTLCANLTSTMIHARWELEQRIGLSIPVPFLALLIFWLTIVFASFGVFAPTNAITIVALFLCSVAVAGGIVLIEDLDNPGSGLIRLSFDSMRKALDEIRR